ncbi:MAG: ABC transporter permease [Eubacteriales bacterium]
MFDIDIIKLAWMSLWRRKLRTILTMVGIMIGTAGIVIMISLGVGLERSIVGELEGANMNTIQVLPAMSKTGDEMNLLDKDDIVDLKTLDGVKAVTPVYTTNGELAIGREQMGVTLVGVDMNVAEDLGYKLMEGRFPRRNEILLGSTVLKEVIENTGNDDIIRKPASIVMLGSWEEDKEPETFTYRSRIIGSIEQTGDSEDYSAVMDIDTLIDMAEESSGTEDIIKEQGYNNIRVIADQSEVVEGLSEEINEMGYTAISTQTMLDAVGSVFSFLQIFLGGIGSIALLVAAIGITNTMIMSIYERTKEIGVNKVIGASVKDIRMQFLYEASFIGLMGGVAGLIFSYLVNMLINFIAGIYMNSQGGGAEAISLVYIPPWLAFFAIAFSVVVGILAGLYPANRAAKISVLEALRQE